MLYPARLAKDGDGWLVTFPDIPEAITGADTEKEALQLAEDALLTAFDFYFEDSRAIPLPSVEDETQYFIPVPAHAWAKVLLLNSMLERGVTQIELARRLHTTRQSVQRLVNLHHATKIESLMKAISATGKKLVLSVE